MHYYDVVTKSRKQKMRYPTIFPMPRRRVKNSTLSLTHPSPSKSDFLHRAHYLSPVWITFSFYLHAGPGQVTPCVVLPHVCLSFLHHSSPCLVTLLLQWSGSFYVCVLLSCRALFVFFVFFVYTVSLIFFVPLLALTCSPLPVWPGTGTIGAFDQRGQVAPIMKCMLRIAEIGQRLEC